MHATSRREPPTGALLRECSNMIHRPLCMQEPTRSLPKLAFYRAVIPSIPTATFRLVLDSGPFCTNDLMCMVTGAPGIRLGDERLLLWRITCLKSTCARTGDCLGFGCLVAQDLLLNLGGKQNSRTGQSKSGVASDPYFRASKALDLLHRAGCNT